MGTFRVSPDEYLARFSVSPEDYLAGVRKPKVRPAGEMPGPGDSDVPGMGGMPLPGVPMAAAPAGLDSPEQPGLVKQAGKALYRAAMTPLPQQAAEGLGTQYESQPERLERGFTGPGGVNELVTRAIDTVGGSGTTEALKQNFPALPYAGNLIKEGVKAVGGLAEFTTSPTGMALPVVHKVAGVLAPYVEPAIGAAFSTDMAPGAGQAIQEAYKNPNADTIPAAIAQTAMVALPLAGAAGVEMRNRGAAAALKDARAAQTVEASKPKTFSDTLVEMPADALLATRDATTNPFQRGLIAKEINRRKATNQWDVQGPAPEPMNREARRAEVAPPETGAPEPIETAPAPIDPKKQQVAAQLGLGDYTQLSPADREVIDSLTREPEPAPLPPLRVSPEQYIARQLGFGAVENLQPWQREVLQAELERRTAPPEVPNPKEGGTPLASEPTQPAGKGVIQSSNPEGPSGASEGPEGAEPKYKFGSTQINLPPEVAEPIRQAGLSIPDEHLAADGRETEPHVTVKYGLKDTSPEAIEKLRETLSQQPPVEVGFGKTSIFPESKPGGGDVVKVDVDSPALHKLNALVKEAVPSEDTHPTYQPHATIAYVKPGMGRQYEGNEFLAGKKTIVDRVLVSDRDGNKVEIPLDGQKGAEAAPKADATKPIGAAPVTPKAPEPVADGAPESFSAFDRLAAEASSRLSSAFKGTTLSANPAGMIGDLAIVGAHKLARGVTKFGDWTKEMIRDYGDQIKPHLWQIWAESKKWMAERMPERRGASPARMATQRGALSIPPLSPDIPPRGPVPVPGRLTEVPKPERVQVSPHADESWSNLIEKSGLSEESKLGLIDSIDKYMKANPERRVVTDAEYKEMAAKVDPLTVWQIDPKKITRGNLPPREVMEAAVGMKDALQAEIERKTVELAKMPADAPAEAVQKANGELESLIRDQQKLLDIIFPVRSEHGRNLRMWGVEAMANLDPVYWIARARRAAGLKPNVPLPGDLEPRLLKVIAETKAAEDEAAGNAAGQRKPAAKPSTPKPGPRAIPEQTPEQRMETLRRRELARLNGELNGKRLVNGMTAEERQALASDPEIADLRAKVHEKRAADKPIKTDDQVIADEIERERRRLSKILEDEPTTARVDRLTPEQRAAVDRDAGIQSLRDRLRQKQLAQREAARIAKQNIPESHVIEKGVGREIDRAEKMGDQITNPTAPTPKAQMTPEQLAAINSDPRVLAARQKLVKLMNEVQRDGLLASISAVRRAGLLTAAKTWMRNIGGNTAFQFAEETARIPSAVVDAAISIFTHRRTVQGADPVAFAKAGYQAATRGMKEARDIMTHGLTESQLQQFDFRKELNSGSKVLDAYVNTVMRFMSAQDRVYKVFAYERSLAEQVKLAKVDTPTEAMRAQAIADADFATFNNRNKVATGFSDLRSRQSSAVKFGFDLIVPFSQTPSNVVLRALDYTPIGAAFRLAGGIKKAFESHGMTPEAQRQISQAIGRGATGSALIYLGYWMAKNNMMTGNRPDNPGEVRADQAARRQWGSVRIGDTWYQVNAFSPIGNLLTTGAALYEGAHAAVKGSPAEQIMKRAGYISGAAVKTVFDMPMMQGVDLVEKVKQSPATTIASAAGKIAGSFVPTAVADIGSALDPYQRDRGTGADSFTGQIKARVPVLRETLPIKRDAFGEPIEQNRFAGIDPTLHQQSREDTDPVAKEIATEQVRLGAAKKLPGESEALYQFRLRIRGAALRRKMDEAINGERYQDLPGLKEGSEARRDALAGASHKATAMVNRILTPRYSKLDEEEKAARLQRAAELLNVQP